MLRAWAVGWRSTVWGQSDHISAGAAWLAFSGPIPRGAGSRIRRRVVGRARVTGIAVACDSLALKLEDPGLVMPARRIADRKLPNKRRTVRSDGCIEAFVQLSAVGGRPWSWTNSRRATTASSTRESATSRRGTASPSNTLGGFALWELRSTTHERARHSRLFGTVRPPVQIPGPRPIVWSLRDRILGLFPSLTATSWDLPPVVPHDPAGI